MSVPPSSRARHGAGDLRIAILIDVADHSAGDLLTIVGAVAAAQWGRCSATGLVGMTCVDSATARIVERRCRCGHALDPAPARAITASVLIRDPAATAGARGHVTRLRRWLELEHDVDVLIEPAASDDDVVAWFVGHDVHLAGPASSRLPTSVRLATAARVPSLVPMLAPGALPPWVRPTPVRTDVDHDGSRSVHAEIGPAAQRLVDLAHDRSARSALDRRP